MKHGDRLLIGVLVAVALAVTLAPIGSGAQGSLAAGVTIYVDVDATGINNGTSWENAFTELESALFVATTGDQIWVATGTYKPTVEHGGTGNRYKSFQMKNGVALYGGFDPSAGDAAWEDRDWVANPTILSGDIGIEGDRLDNSYHVFYHPAGTNLNSSAILDGFTITGGNANGPAWPHWDAGGMYNDGSSPMLANCTFSANSATYSGGGMLNDNSSSPALINCTFAGNWTDSALGGGGGMNNSGSSPELTNCTFSGNSADYAWGGGMYNNYSSSPVLTNCAFEGNSAASGGGMANYASSSPTVINSILWGDGPQEISNNDAGSSPIVTYSDIQGGYSGVGNIVEDPLFIDAAVGDLRLQLTSPAIDAGDSDAPGLAGVTIDLCGNPRIAGIVDMGACETPPEVIFVDLAATGNSNGTSWDDALTGLQGALTWAVDGVEIWVAEGIYKPTAEHGGTGDRYKSFQMKNEVAIYGGFAGTESRLEERDWVSHATILTGDLNGNDGPDFANNDENSYHVFYHPESTGLKGTAILDGFTITGGNANGGTYPHWAGGGMYNHSSSPALRSCTFAGNSAAIGGGGMLNEVSSSPALTDCTFSANRSEQSGGGMFNDISSPVLTNCTFADNSAYDSGGGILNTWDSSARLINCTFSGNSAVYDGGGMFIYRSSPVLTNCTFTGNSASHGAGVCNMYSSPALTNCILWKNSPDQISNDSSSPVVTYSDVQGGYSGVGNIDADPLFVDAANDDFHLRPASPCIEAGNNAAPDLPDHDFEGDPRIIDGDRDGTATVDMGVDEARIHVYLPVVLGR